MLHELCAHAFGQFVHHCDRKFAKTLALAEDRLDHRFVKGINEDLSDNVKYGTVLRLQSKA